MTVSNTSTQGGGLTADLIARAVIAAARTYGDNPLEVFGSTRRLGTRALPPAASGAALATGIPLTRVAEIMGLNPNSVKVSRYKALGLFREAEAAARRAATYARWRPEAAASVAGVDEEAQPIEVRGRVVEGPDAVGPGEQVVAPGGDLLPPAAEVPTGRPRSAIAQKLANLHNAGPKPPPARIQHDPPPAKRAGEPEFRPPSRPANVAPASAPGGRAFDPRRPAPPAPAGSLERRVLDLLGEGSANTQGMATILDVKESVVGMTLRILQHAGKVIADPVPPEGLRAQRWRLAA